MKLIYSSALFYGIVLCCLPFWCLTQTTPDYCLSKGNKNSLWINNLKVGAWNYQSGNNNGYLSLTQLDWPLQIGYNYALQLEMGGVARIQDTLYWQIWLDSNGDKDFLDHGEQLFKAKTLQRVPAKGQLIIPFNLLSGAYHLRLMLSKKAFASACGEGAEVQEVEDYQVNIKGLDPCPPLDTANIQIHWLGDGTAEVVLNKPDSLLYHLELYDESQTLVKAYPFLQTDTVLLSKLNAGSVYGVRVQLQCPPTYLSEWSPQVKFSTASAFCPMPELKDFYVKSLEDNQYQFIANISAQTYIWRYRVKGDTVWADSISWHNDTLDWVLPYDDLTLEIQLSIVCENQGRSSWKYVQTFQSNTLTCALPSAENLVTRYNINEGKLQLIAGISAQLYRWRLRAVGDTSWKEITTTQGEFRIDTVFVQAQEVQLQILCSNGKYSPWSANKIIFQRECPQSTPNTTEHFDYFHGGIPAVWILWISEAPGATIPATYRWSYREAGLQSWSSPVRTIQSNVVLEGMTPGKTYEIRMEIICGKDSLNPQSVIELKEMPNSCVEINATDVKLRAFSDMIEMDVQFPNAVPYQVRIRQQDSVQYDTLLGLGQWMRQFINLAPGTTYEISLRGYCYDGTELPWSDPLFVRTLSCKLPRFGRIEMDQFDAPDSIGFTANFITPPSIDTVAINYHWQYRVRDSSNWTRTASNKAHFPYFTVQNVQPNTNYELQLVTHCINNPIDSFVLSTYFSTDPMQCGSKPDTSVLSIDKYPWPGSSYHRVTSKLPDTYLWSARVLQREGNEWTILSTQVYQRILPSFQVPVDDDKAFQFRIICPNNTVGPWSEIIFPGAFAKPEEPISLFKGFILKEKLVVAPNPSNGQFNILLPAEIPADQSEGWLEVFNVSGQKVLNRKTSVIAGDALGLDLSDQRPGMYLLRLKIGKQVFTERLLLSTNR